MPRLGTFLPSMSYDGVEEKSVPRSSLQECYMDAGGRGTHGHSPDNVWPAETQCSAKDVEGYTEQKA